MLLLAVGLYYLSVNYFFGCLAVSAFWSGVYEIGKLVMPHNYRAFFWKSNCYFLVNFKAMMTCFLLLSILNWWPDPCRRMTLLNSISHMNLF